MIFKARLEKEKLELEYGWSSNIFPDDESEEVSALNISQKRLPNQTQSF